MTDYTFSVGTDDPVGFSAESEPEAIALAAAHAGRTCGTTLDDHPETVVTLMGPSGLVTRPSERLDEFLARVNGVEGVTGAETLQPGDTNAPDCNGD